MPISVDIMYIYTYRYIHINDMSIWKYWAVLGSIQCHPTEKVCIHLDILVFLSSHVSVCVAVCGRAACVAAGRVQQRAPAPLPAHLPRRQPRRAIHGKLHVIIHKHTYTLYIEDI